MSICPNCDIPYKNYVESKKTGFWVTIIMSAIGIAFGIFVLGAYLSEHIFEDDNYGGISHEIDQEQLNAFLASYWKHNTTGSLFTNEMESHNLTDPHVPTNTTNPQIDILPDGNDTVKKATSNWNWDHWPSSEPFYEYEAMAEYSGVGGIVVDTKKRFSNSYAGGFKPEDHAYYYNYHEYGAP